MIRDRGTRGGGGSSSGGATSLRTTATNRNAIAYSANSSNVRHQQYRIKKYVPANATWSGFQVREINIVAGSTNENTSSPGRIVRKSIKYNGTFYPVTWAGASYIYLAPGASATSDTIVGLTGISGADIEECGWNTYNLKFDGQTGNFTIGQTVTGTTSGATGVIVAQTDSGASGSLTLISETGTWQDNEAITDPLGGAAVVDLTNQSIPVAVGTQDFWLEGNLATNVSPATGFLAADPLTPAVGTPVINGSGVITGVTRSSNGASYTSGPSLVAWCETSDGQIFYKSIGYAFIGSGSVTGVSITGGTPPSGLAAWPANTNVTFTGGGGFGQTTSITCSSDVTAIPSTAVKSLIILGDSVARGFSSTDARGDIYHNYGYVERAVRGRCGILNAAISSLQATSWANYASFYPITMAWILQGNYTHCKIHIGINDATAGRSETNLQTDLNNMAAIHRPYGTKVAFCTILNGTTSTDSFATEANQTVRTGCGLGGVVDNINTKIRNGTIVSDWTITDARLVSQGVDQNKWAVSQSWTTDGLHYVAYTGIANAASAVSGSFNQIA